jgi:hypothetical protein
MLALTDKQLAAVMAATSLPVEKRDAFLERLATEAEATRHLAADEGPAGFAPARAWPRLHLKA